jgi:hypothetical protein
MYGARLNPVIVASFLVPLKHFLKSHRPSRVCPKTKMGPTIVASPVFVAAFYRSESNFYQ